MTKKRRYGPDWLHDKIASGARVIIDGGMGTELEARGVPMHAKAWSGAAMLTHPEVVRAAHVDYIKAGAEVIITNTFAAGRRLLDRAGLGDEMANINRSAVDVARQAREECAEHPVAIAGSMNSWDWAHEELPSNKQLLRGFAEQAELLAEAGVDLIALEMCSHPVTSPLITEAAVATGLPVWLGLSCRQDAKKGGVVGFEAPHVDFDQLVVELVEIGASVINIMHSSIDDTTAGLAVLKRHWPGPYGAYPESGYFKMPNWQFVDIIAPDDLVRRARVWLEDGVQIIGGCCGLGLPHIRALKAAFG